MKWIDLTDDLTLTGRSIPVGRVLIFDKDGVETHIKIMRKRNGKVWGKIVYMYKPEEVGVKDKIG